MTEEITRNIDPYVFIKNKNLDLSGSVATIETYKSINNPTGSFSLSVWPGDTQDTISTPFSAEKLYKLIEPMDIIEIGIDKPGLMLGLVEKPQKRITMNAESYDREISIKGKDFGKPLISDTITYSPQLLGNTYAEKILGAERLQFLGLFFKGFESQHGFSEFYWQNPICPIIYILKNMPSIHIEIAYTDIVNDEDKQNASLVKLGKFMLFDGKAFLSDQVAETLLTTYAGTIWNYMQNCMDQNFYELFVDTISVKVNGKQETRPCLYLRPKPFDRVSDNVIRYKEIQNKFAEFQTDNPKLQFFFDQHIAMNKVIAPKFENNDYVFNTTYDKNSPVAKTGVEKELVTYVSLADMDNNGFPKEDSLRYQNERSSEHPESMVVPWTWDGKDSSYKTRITGESFHTIPGSEILDYDVGVSDDQVIDYITFKPRKDLMQNTLVAQLGHLYPLIDGAKVQRYGLRAFEAESNLMREQKLTPDKIDQAFVKADPNEKDVFIISEYINNRDRLFNWYRYADIFEEGTIVTKGNQDYRIGDKIFLPDAISKGGHAGMYFYLVGVRQRATIKPTKSWTTTLEVTRGENPIDLMNYASQINRIVELTQQYKDASEYSQGTSQKAGDNAPIIHLGSTYRNYDAVYGFQFKDYDPTDPKAHNIIKADFLNSLDLDEVKTNDYNKNQTNDEEEDQTGSSPTAKYTGYISKDALSAFNYIKSNMGTIYGGSISDLTPTTDANGNFLGGMSADGVHRIGEKVYKFLECIGRYKWSFGKITIVSLSHGHTKYVHNSHSVSRHYYGQAVDITIDGFGTDAFKENITFLAKAILGRLDAGEVDIGLHSLLISRGCMPSQIICYPYSDDRDDASDHHYNSATTRSDHRNHIHLSFDKLQ